ncbi:MAG: ATP-binding cassette domain-containing protein [Saprospiraceae bacterium]|nr:ATP-binding cassette domain-containing protein [Saprospiraceae bacterium]MBK8449912.1 ATP-binding cassette domain-containing protein [Saprospiraceae bacterium]MBK8484031.1 ATP-binding cassette domain-containing protein [Saprospiraceae bacterium]MBK9221435.1 ATP-binding cassette domain-containing protein [Saprospiraceae bacterium]MBK9721627.1 ATP-binding cassette domain-containing protein [Saprospiraceae bacterium]
MSKHVIQAINLNLGYNDEYIISSLNWTLQEGDWVEIQASNSAGKSTLLDSIYGNPMHCSGQLLVLDYSLIPLNKSDKLEIRRKIGYASQKNRLLLNKTLRANLLMALDASDKVFDQTQDELISNLLEKLELKHLVKTEIEHMSNSDQVLVSIARALINKPKLLLMDQSLDALDVTRRNMVIELIQQLRQTERMTILSTSLFGIAPEITTCKSLRMNNGQFIVGS